MLLILACVSRLLGAGWLGRGTQLPPALRTGGSGDLAAPRSLVSSPAGSKCRPRCCVCRRLGAWGAHLCEETSRFTQSRSPQGSPQWFPQTVTALRPPPPPPEHAASASKSSRSGRAPRRVAGPQKRQRGSSRSLWKPLRGLGAGWLKHSRCPDRGRGLPTCQGPPRGVSQTLLHAQPRSSPWRRRAALAPAG